MSDQPRFYYDLRDPDCYLWAERINADLLAFIEGRGSQRNAAE